MSFFQSTVTKLREISFIFLNSQIKTMSHFIYPQTVIDEDTSDVLVESDFVAVDWRLSPFFTV